ncbi:hypothetical protein BU14_1288s0002 [Porphyra umbilicalis]|uniref:Oxygen-evolving enhancer protein 1, chloroplastic n=1 Tax=Porphyra umbilicalis TaxID=2786 RepID=A0A1X6NM98_PORUM|nr:hypothetical protein BU14_1288s0002 [Porphyra umbilicalis]|eukprot:OSX69670.1 hypothetical protein BU14_1288s0002 [Porphyra umbilicalis]
MPRRLHAGGRRGGHPHGRRPRRCDARGRRGGRRHLGGGGADGAPPPAAALTAADIRSLTYEQVKGTGLANRCPEVDVSKGSIPLSSGKAYKLVDMCLEPKTFLVEEEVGGKRGEVRKAFVDTKLMTRATYTLTGIEGTLRSEGDRVVFEEKEGIDYAATTVQLPGGERVPFLFTIKSLVASAQGGGQISTATEFGGPYKVPSYRTGGFLDPKGRGMVTGYDMAVGLPALEADGREGQSKLEKETNKKFDVTDGEIEMAINAIDASSGEIGGVFVAEQLTDTDMGAKQPHKVLVKGIFYARVVEA